MRTIISRTVVEKLNKQIFPSMALTKFAENLLTNSLRIKEFSEHCPKNISVNFHKTMTQGFNLSRQSFDLAVTSPPYANAVDYPRTHQLEMSGLVLQKVL